MEYTSVPSVQRTLRAKILGLIALAVVGTLIASYAVFTPASTQLDQIYMSIDQDTFNEYRSWQKKYGIHFTDSTEDKYRASIFAQAHLIIKSVNSQNKTYKLGHGPFSHLTQAEFAARYLGFIKPNDANPPSDSENTHRILTTLPTSVNWTAKGAVTPVKNQGSCGSCYTFSSTGALEGLAYIKNKKLLSFSEQQFLDCTYQGKYGNQGCNGGWMGECYQYAIDNKGVASESSYPYKGKLQTCNTAAPKVWGGVTGWKWVTQNSSSALIAAIATNPTSVTIEADSHTFQYYSSGVISGSACGTNNDHAVLAVGYDTKAGYYYVKNSWGTSWGDYGYFRVKITGDGAGTCGIQQYNTIPN